MHIVLVNPLIPQNTGSISRLCAGTYSELHLVGRLGFSLEDRLLKRAGLDYWPNVVLHLHPDFDHLVDTFSPGRMAFFTSHATRPYSEFAPDSDAWLVFGQETTGLPAALRRRFSDHLYKIPMSPHTRSLNLATSAGIVLYDALRQLDFPELH
jgi:tRNA (cytidine/uridine-2'-O-)-methyltransferase